MLTSLFLFSISFPWLSRFYGRLVRIERPRWLVRRVIALFMRHYAITMDDYRGTPDDYRSLGAFFIRPLDPAKRTIPTDAAHFLAPADSVLTVCETVHADAATQVKGRQYRITELVGEPLDLAAGWRVAVLYLSPHDYHRYHLSMGGTLVAARRDGARLYPVNRLSVNNIDNLFVRNERVTLKFNTNGRDWYYIAVGATFVGSIETAAGDIPTAGQWYPRNKELSQSAEVGLFNMGSTIIVVVPAMLAGEPLAALGAKVKTGDKLWRVA